MGGEWDNREIWGGVSIYQPVVLSETLLGKFVKTRLLNFPPQNCEPGDLGGAQEIVVLTRAHGMPPLPSKY